MNEVLKMTIQSIYGQRGEAWLAALPHLLKELQEKWQFSLDSEFSNLSYNYVLKGNLSDGESVVLKCGVPSPELTTEMVALKQFNGQGSVRLLEVDESLGAMLLERVIPGTSLAKIENEDKASEIFSYLMAKLHHPIKNTEPFPTVQNWFEGFDRLYKTFNKKTGPFDVKLIDRAEKIGRELIDSMGKTVLLHGDLHHENILTATRDSWLTIDPKGVIGESEYEVGAFLRNPIAQLVKTEMNKRLARRLDCLAELTGFDRQRLWGWSFSQAVLAAIWCFEDAGIVSQLFIQCAEVLKQLQ